MFQTTNQLQLFQLFDGLIQTMTPPPMLHHSHGMATYSNIKHMNRLIPMFHQIHLSSVPNLGRSLENAAIVLIGFLPKWIVIINPQHLG